MKKKLVLIYSLTTGFNCFTANQPLKNGLTHLGTSATIIGCLVIASKSLRPQHYSLDLKPVMGIEKIISIPLPSFKDSMIISASLVGASAAGYYGCKGIHNIWEYIQTKW